MQICNEQLVLRESFPLQNHKKQVEIFNSLVWNSLLRQDLCLLALEGSVENADESNEGDEKEPPPKDEENL